jgi:hypothetical protein
LRLDDAEEAVEALTLAVVGAGDVVLRVGAELPADKVARVGSYGHGGSKKG